MNRKIEKIYEQLVAAQGDLIRMQKDKIKKLEQKLKAKEDYCKRLLKEGFDMQNKTAMLSAKNAKLQKQIDAIEDDEDKQRRTNEERSKDRKWLNRHHI